jgi:hypothetical protein
MNLYRVQQLLKSNPLADVEREVFRQLDEADLTIPQGEVAITAGSRGIDRIDEIIRAAGTWLKQQGASPFIVPAMGSHNGATAEGQRAMIESFGITEEAMDMEIRASMDVVKLGSVSTGDVYMDRHCFESDGVLIVNRIKLHTAFSGPLQSGLTKMMVVGMGKIRSATTFHNTPSDQMAGMLQEMGQCILDTGKIVGGMALLEDGFDRMAEIHVFPPAQILAGEPALVEKHREYFPALPLQELDLLVVDEIGKNYSGTGLDTNVIGYRGVRGYEDLTTPRIQRIAILGLSEKSQGNAFGIGLADFITRRLREAMDEAKTFTNVFTTGDMERIKIPATFESDEDLLIRVEERFGAGRWMFIPNTLHLETLFVTEALVDELKNHRGCEVDEKPLELRFTDGRSTLSF